MEVITLKKRNLELIWWLPYIMYVLIIYLPDD